MIGHKDELIDFVWEQFRQCEHYQPAMELITTTLEEDGNLELVFSAIWKMGFHSAMTAYEQGAIKDLGRQNPETN